MYGHNPEKLPGGLALQAQGKQRSTSRSTVSESHDNFLLFCYRRLTPFNIPTGIIQPDMPLTSGNLNSSRTQILTLRLGGNDETIACIPVGGAKGQNMVRLESGYVRGQELHIRAALLPLAYFKKVARTGDAGIPCPQAGNQTLYQQLFREEVAFSFSQLIPGADTPLNYIASLLLHPQNKKINAVVAAALVMTQGYALDLNDETAGQLYWTPAQIKLLSEFRKRGSGAEKSVRLLPRPDSVAIKKILKSLHKEQINDTLLRGVDLSGCVLNDLDLSYSNMTDANLQFTQLSGATLKRALFRAANLKCANLSGADCRNASFEDADLRFADLSNANLDGVNLSGAHLIQVNLAGATLRKTRFTGAILDIGTVEAILAAFTEKRTHKKILLGASLPLEYQSAEKQKMLRKAGLVLKP